MSPDVDPGDAVFLDLLGTLVDRTGSRFVARPEAEPWLGAGRRLGVLCNAGPGRRARDVERILEEAGVLHYFEPDLVVAASDLRCPLPDPRAFAVAAALARLPIERCVFVSADPALVEGAVAAGMGAANVSWPPPAPPRTPAGVARGAAPGGSGPTAPESESGGRPAPAPPVPGLIAAEVDSDIGPTFVLTGRVVTLGSDGRVVEDVRVVVRRGFIARVLAPSEGLPAEFASAPVVETGGTIYPGLIDLHNHFVYNVLPLWSVPSRYHNRSQWSGVNQYKADVSLPINTLKGYTASARAIVRYVEAKALMGGTTAGQGIRTRVNGGVRLFRGVMRNVEETDDPRLPEAGTLVPTLKRRPSDIEAFRNSLIRHAERRASYFYHLAEGVDDAAHETFTDLLRNDLLQGALVGIHCLGLEPEDLGTLADRRCRVVWSPFSNLLLYGRTIDVGALKDSGATFSIGCDWSPSGSKNLLEELKVARHVVEEQGADLSPEAMVRAVTADAARVAGWQRYVGALFEGAMADLLVIDGLDGDPYDHLIDATESRVSLVVVHGTPRYGDGDVMKRLHSEPGFPLEEWSVGGVDKALHLRSPDSTLNDVTLAEAERILRAAMSDLHGFRDEMERQRVSLVAMGIEEQTFTLELDNEPSEDEGGGGPGAFLSADQDLMAASLDLDGLVVEGPGYWSRIGEERNVDPSLKQALRRAYG